MAIYCDEMPSFVVGLSQTVSLEDSNGNSGEKFPGPPSEAIVLGSYVNHLSSGSSDALLSDLRSPDLYIDKILADYFLHVGGEGINDEQKPNMMTYGHFNAETTVAGVPPNLKRICCGRAMVDVGPGMSAAPTIDLTAATKLALISRMIQYDGECCFPFHTAVKNEPPVNTVPQGLIQATARANLTHPAAAAADECNSPEAEYPLAGLTEDVGLSRLPAARTSSLTSALIPTSRSPPRHQKKEKRNNKKSQTVVGAVVATASRSTSSYRGVTRHRWTGRFEAHLWDSSFLRERKNNKGRRKGKQVYLGGWASEDEAARAYDRAALRFWGASATLNFAVDDYVHELEDLMSMTKEEMVASLRRRSNGFSRGASQFRGVTKHHMHGKWEARIGRVAGNRYLYLGTFSSETEAARAYDKAALQHRGDKAVTNFSAADYDDLTDAHAMISDELLSITAKTHSSASVADPSAATAPAEAMDAEALGLGAQLSANLLTVLQQSQQEFFLPPLDVISPRSDASEAFSIDFIDFMLP